MCANVCVFVFFSSFIVLNCSIIMQEPVLSECKRETRTHGAKGDEGRIRLEQKKQSDFNMNSTV